MMLSRTMPRNTTRSHVIFVAPRSEIRAPIVVPPHSALFACSCGPAPQVNCSIDSAGIAPRAGGPKGPLGGLPSVC